ncbi:MAG: cytochrome c [Anaerolineaceae bacterium]|nr:cytochrome c [Anaerolineaceae bacterium]
MKLNRKLHSLLWLAAACLLLLAGCEEMEMEDQARYEPLEASQFFPDGQASRPILAEVVPRTAYDLSDPVYSGLEDGEPVLTVPLPLTAELLEQGQAQYNIFCSPCHGLSGDGSGMIVQRGFPAPPTFHSERLRQAPDGHYFDVISNGFGLMYEYGTRVEPEGRWAIIAYIRALQLSQNAAVHTLPEADREQLNGAE